MPPKPLPDFQVALVPVTVFQQNCALIWETASKRAIVVDPGGEVGRILDTIDRLGLSPELILLTHGHLDHAGGAKPLKGVLDQKAAEAGLPPIPLLGPDERDLFLLESIEQMSRANGLSGMVNVVPDRFLTEGEIIEFASLRFDVLHCPGHTPGHVVFVEQQQRFAVVGDVLFSNSVGRTDFPYGDGPGLIEHIQTKLLPLGDDIHFICGHGPGSSFGEERRNNPFLQ